MAGEALQKPASSKAKDGPTTERKRRQNISSGTTWEERFGYSRAVLVGDHIHVAGTTATKGVLDVSTSSDSELTTTAMKDGKLVGIGDAAAQAEQIFRNIEAALIRAGASMADVVRTRVYITRHEDWEVVGQVHGRWFGDVKPALSLIVVAGLVDPEMLVEIEAEALVGCG